MTWHPDMPAEYRDAIVTGDARELAAALPDESVDLIFTDPPYLREYLPLYGWLAETSSRVLRPGGYLFAYGAGEYMPDILDLLRVDGLRFFWVDMLIHAGGYPRIWYKQLLSGYKPVFVFTKGAPRALAWRSTVHASVMDKRYHEWGQGAAFAAKIIELLTRPGDVVFDPFCGGGTTAAACAERGRSYTALEQDELTAARARERVEQTQAMHPILLGEQAEMELAV